MDYSDVTSINRMNSALCLKSSVKTGCLLFWTCLMGFCSGLIGFGTLAKPMMFLGLNYTDSFLAKVCPVYILILWSLRRNCREVNTKLWKMPSHRRFSRQKITLCNVLTSNKQMQWLSFTVCHVHLDLFQDVFFIFLLSDVERRNLKHVKLQGQLKTSICHVLLFSEWLLG